MRVILYVLFHLLSYTKFILSYHVLNYSLKVSHDSTKRFQDNTCSSPCHAIECTCLSLVQMCDCSS